jgi:primary-amine oxidase
MRLFLIGGLCLLNVGCGANSNWTSSMQAKSQIHAACQPYEPDGVSVCESSLTHVIDPLSASELELAVNILRQHNLVGENWFIQTLYTHEPDKNSDGMYPSPADVSRKAFAVLVNLESLEKVEIVINLVSGLLESKTPILHGQPALLIVEQIKAKKAIAADARVQRAMIERGLDLKFLYVEPWAAGDLSEEKDIDRTHRFVRGTLYYRQDSTNPYARPIEGISTLYDTNTGEVWVKDAGKFPLQSQAHDFFKVSHKAKSAPDGFNNTHPNIKVMGREVEWRGWKFRFQNHPREGLVLYDLKRQNKGLYVSVLERASLSEMIVPYADPDDQWFWKSAFDEGEYGIGANTNSLMRGVHFPTHGLGFPGELVSETGELTTIENAVVVFEKDGGVAWSHYDWDTNTQAGRASKELVLLSFFTVGNYDYGLQWTFREDGSIEMQVLLTGVLLTKGSKIKKCGRCENLSLFSIGDQYGTVVDKNLIAIAHQHHFNMRLDFAVGGGKNSIAEIALNRADSSENMHGNAYLISERLLRTEKEAVSKVDYAQAKHWWIFNRAQKNSLGHYAGFLLEPGKSSDYYGSTDASVFQRAPFLAHNFYVTKFHPKEMHAAGDHPSQTMVGDGIPVWISKRNAEIQQEDLVVWYTAGVTHLPCAEEWPIMSLHRAGFSLRPMGFHERNPLMDMDEALLQK